MCYNEYYCLRSIVNLNDGKTESEIVRTKEHMIKTLIFFRNRGIIHFLYGADRLSMRRENPPPLSQYI